MAFAFPGRASVSTGRGGSSTGSRPWKIDRAAAFQERWGGLALPTAPFHEGGPRILGAGCPEGSAAEGWLFPAGSCRVSMAYGCKTGFDGSFGINAYRWTPPHASTDGWVESLALTTHAGRWARAVTKIKGEGRRVIGPRRLRAGA